VVLAVVLAGADTDAPRPVEGLAVGGMPPAGMVRADTTDSTRAGARSSGRSKQNGEADTTTTRRPWHEEAWNRIAVIDGVAFSYLYYSKADEVNDGVVIRLENTSDQTVTVSFTVLFRTPEDEASATYRGRLAPGEMKTGGNDGLYWVPFTSGASIGEVGLRGVRVE
jgi:hypothetical protein